MNAAQARDDIMGMLWTAWQAGAAAAAGTSTVPPMIWEDDEVTSPPVQGVAYGHASMTHNTGRQASLAGDGGTKVWSRTGIVIVQCFGPRDAKGLAIAAALADVAKNAFEGRASPNGAWFRNCRTQEVGPDTGFWQVNAVAEFQYDEVR